MRLIATGECNRDIKLKWNDGGYWRIETIIELVTGIDIGLLAAIAMVLGQFLGIALIVWIEKF